MLGLLLVLGLSVTFVSSGGTSEAELEEAAMQEYLDTHTQTRRRGWFMGKAKGKRHSVRENFEKEKCKRKPPTRACFHEPYPTVAVSEDDGTWFGILNEVWFGIFAIVIVSWIGGVLFPAQQLKQLAAASKQWEELSDSQRGGARVLGFDEFGWNARVTREMLGQTRKRTPALEGGSQQKTNASGEGQGPFWRPQELVALQEEAFMSGRMQGMDTHLWLQVFARVPCHWAVPLACKDCI